MPQRPVMTVSGESGLDIAGLDLVSVARNGEVVLFVQGELDLATAPLLSQRLAKEIPGVTTRLVLDLYDVPFVDSIGLGVFARACKQLRRTGADLVLRYPGPQATKVLGVSGLDRVFTIQS